MRKAKTARAGSPLTLACILDRISSAQHLTALQRRDMRSAFRTVARLSGRPLPARHGLSSGRWTNIRSLALKALDAAGVPRQPGRCSQRPSPAWQQCLEPLANKPYRIALLPLARHCTRIGIEPSELRQEIFDGFAREREDLCGRARPRETYRSTCRIWNLAVQAYSHMPRVQVELDDRRQRYTLPWSSFPESLKQDVEAMVQAAASPDPLDVDAHKPLRNATVAGRRRACQALASALVQRGRAAETIRSISDLVRAEAAKEALRFFLERTGERRSAYLRDLARLLCSLARHWVYARHPALSREEEEARNVNLKMLDGFRKNLEPDHSLTRAQQLEAASKALGLAEREFYSFVEDLLKSEPAFMDIGLPSTRARQLRLWQEVHLWEAAAGLAIKRLRRSDGTASATPDEATRNLLDGLAVEYRSAGGKVAASKSGSTSKWSPFVYLVGSLLNLVGKPTAPATLATTIRRWRRDSDFGKS